MATQLSNPFEFILTHVRQLLQSPWLGEVTGRLRALGLCNALAILGLGYLSLVRLLRWRRYHAIHRQYQSRYDPVLQKWNLSPEEARRIMLESSAYDMPKLINSALSFALFKTYAIPSISKLLYATKELGSKENIAKRYADTEILISTWVGCPLTGFHDLSVQPDGKSPVEDPRGMIALARTNYLHSRYKIPNGDYLYTLALFVIEPAVWTQQYGWRALSPMECEAYFIFWSEIGKRMGIQDIPETREDLIAFSKAYEEEYMVPAKTNQLVAQFTTGELVDAVPQAFGLRRFVERLTICLLEERVRIAMIRDAQPWYLHAIASSTLHTVGFVQRWLCLPRTKPNYPVDIEPRKDTNVPLRPAVFRSRPWYKPESRGLGYLVDRLLMSIGYYSAMPSEDLRSGGYRLEELGPVYLEKTANEEVLKAAEKFYGCPVSKLY